MTPLRIGWNHRSQTEAEVWLRETYAERLAKWLTQQDSKTNWESCNPMETGDWLLSSCLSDVAGNPKCTVHPFAADISGHKAVCFVHRPWMVWNQNLLISSWPCTWHEKVAHWTSSAEEYSRCTVIWENIKGSAGPVADSEPQTRTPEHVQAFRYRVSSDNYAYAQGSPSFLIVPRSFLWAMTMHVRWVQWFIVRWRFSP